MFVDRVKIFVKGGDGGRGCVSFRREPYVPKGGPDGGVGGKGGDVALVAVSHQNTLLPLRYHTEFRATRGTHGGPGNRTGAEGGDLLIQVPPGTAAVDEGTGEPLGEVLRDGDLLVLAKDHTLFALADGFVRYEDHGARGRLVSVLPAAS